MAEPRYERGGQKLPAHKRIGFGAATVLSCVLLVEALLQALALAIPAIDRVLDDEPIPLMVEDAILGHRPNPRVAEHDEAGFRNVARPSRADIVCIGDSQTYGTSSRATEAWPQQLAALSSLSTYNMAFGGYGPSHYLVLSREAAALDPKLILVGLYSGNDLVEAFEMVHGRGQLAFLGGEAGDARPDPDEAARVYRQPWDELSALTRKPPPEPPSLLDRSRLRQLVRALQRPFADPEDPHEGRDERTHTERMWQKQRKTADTARRPDLLWAYEGEDARTILSPATRLAVLRLDDPVVAEGFRLSLAALRLMAEESRGRRALGVVLIPTKELVFYDSAREQGKDLPSALHELAHHEAELWRRVKAHLDALGIEWIDTLPALRAALRDGANPYRESPDGHPGAVGHLAIARAVIDSTVLQRLGARHVREWIR